MSLVDKKELCALIPHEGDMCLLDEVLEWNDDHIQCRSNTHIRKSHPLRSSSGLNSVVLLEYGAQAMAVHGGLLAREKGQKINEGYLAALRDVQLKDIVLEDIMTPLLVSADKLMAQEGNMIYQFSVRTEHQVLASGRATVISR